MFVLSKFCPLRTFSRKREKGLLVRGVIVVLFKNCLLQEILLFHPLRKVLDLQAAFLRL